MPVDPEFLAGCIHRVAVFADAAAGGASTSPHGGVGRDWRPVPGQDAVACRVVPDRDAERVNDKPGAVVYHLILLPQAPDPAWDQNTRADLVDRSGVTHRMFVRGQPREAHYMGHHWVARATEFVA